jgi:hypothetical protein
MTKKCMRKSPESRKNETLHDLLAHWQCARAGYSMEGGGGGVLSEGHEGCGVPLCFNKHKPTHPKFRVKDGIHVLTLKTTRRCFALFLYSRFKVLRHPASRCVYKGWRTSIAIRPANAPSTPYRGGGGGGGGGG